MKVSIGNGQHWLHWFTSEDDWRVVFNSILAITDGRAAATDGVIYVEEKTPDESVHIGAVPGDDIRQKVSDLLEKPTTHVMSRSAVMAMLDGSKYQRVRTPCPDCNGTKKAKHECDCELCIETEEDCRCVHSEEKDYYTETPKTPATLLGYFVDARRVHYLLLHTPGGDDIQVGVVGQLNNCAVLLFRNSSWQALVCCLNNESSTSIDIPVQPCQR